MYHHHPLCFEIKPKQKNLEMSKLLERKSLRARVVEPQIKIYKRTAPSSGLLSQL
jgi:hypothetical protein